MTAIVGAFFLIFTSSTSAFAHGEDKPGPHKGIVRMPGAFHTELVPHTLTRYEVFLLDMDWKNATVEKSKVAAVLKTVDGKKVSLACAASRESFTCNLSDGQSPKLGDKLLVKATRKGTSGDEAIYEFPLQLPGGH